MRLAVCFFGHVGSKSGHDGAGGWLNPKDTAYNFDKLFPGVDTVDIFVHSWSVDYEEQIRETYNPKKMVTEPQIDFSIHSIGDYSLSHINTYKPICQSYKNPEACLTREVFATHSRWFSTMRSVNLMSQYCDEEGSSYDWVMQLRFDLCFSVSFMLDQLDASFLYAGARPKDADIAVDDVWFLSNQQNAEKFGQLHDRIFDYSIRATCAAKQHLDYCKIPHRELGLKGKHFNLVRYQH